jgi:HJR/Mrr/RecB family endonuclease
MSAKASTRPVKLNKGGHVSLKFVKAKTSQTCYKLSEGIAVGLALQKFRWKRLDSQELAAAFLDTGVYKKQSAVLAKTLQRVIPPGLGIDSDTMFGSVLFNGMSPERMPVLREWYDAEILLNEPKYRTALKQRLSELDGHTFEDLMCAFFQIKAFGYQVTRTPRTRDHGIDLFLTHHDEVFGDMCIAVQCKCQHATVGDRDVRDLMTDMSRAKVKADRGVFVTTSQFTKSAHDFAMDDKHIHLIDGEKLTELFFRYAEQSPGLWGTLRRAIQLQLP